MSTDGQDANAWGQPALKEPLPLTHPPLKGKGKGKPMGSSPSNFDIFLSSDDTVDPEILAQEEATGPNDEGTLDLSTSLNIGVIPSLPSSMLTPTPTRGFPKICGLSLRCLAENVTKDTKDIWNTLTPPLVLVTIAYAKLVKEFSMSYVVRLQAAITTIIGRTKDLIVSPSKVMHTNYATLPQPFIIAGLTPEQADALTNKQCWSTPDITFFAFPTTILVSKYIMTLVRFVIPSTPENEAFVTDIVRNRLLNNPDFLTWLAAEDNRDNIPPRVKFEEIPKFITDTITASTIEVKEQGEIKTVYRICMLPPSNNHNVVDDLTNYLKNNTYYPSTRGIGRPKKADYRCIVCRGCNHPTGLCPFKKVPGFFNNDPTAVDKKNTTSSPTSNATMGTSTTPTPTSTSFSFSNIPPNSNRSQLVDPYAPSPGYGNRGYGGRGGRGNRGGRGRGRGSLFRTYKWSNTYDEFEGGW
ncbi:hypothetical protein EST38_g12679 [Candolleomyces aberdarensis]|uniref:Uncharacterized protein n=1 Tax=Candolleomyces aberdarensis TaxID=2316362 RepID=A0A4Q2D4T5_9AGAR|nr:hypothetical protein EST38_g12679 [Candolleomyces aberdarensis]